LSSIERSAETSNERAATPRGGEPRPQAPGEAADGVPLAVQVPWLSEQVLSGVSGRGETTIQLENETLVSIADLAGPRGLAAVFALCLGRTGGQAHYDLTLVTPAGSPSVRFAPDPEQATDLELERACAALERSLTALAEGVPTPPGARPGGPVATPAGILLGGDPADGPALTLDPGSGDGAGGRPRLVYDAARLSEQDARVLADSLAAFARGIAQEPGRPLGRQPLLDAATRARVLEEWNGTSAAYPESLCVHAAIEEQVDATPDAPALSFEDETLSYAELDARANRLAHRLRSLGVGPDALVGVHLERGLDLVVAALAVQKAGGAYVALDPTYPAERIRLMVEDSGARWIVTQTALAGAIDDTGAECLLVGSAEREPATRPEPVACSSNLAYAIYTSGSTGRPKGVLVEHRNVVSFFTAMDAVVPRDDRSVWLAVTTLSFDISVLELFYTLARGGGDPPPGHPVDGAHAAGRRGDPRGPAVRPPPALRGRAVPVVARGGAPERSLRDGHEHVRSHRDDHLVVHPESARRRRCGPHRPPHREHRVLRARRARRAGSARRPG